MSGWEKLGWVLMVMAGGAIFLLSLGCTPLYSRTTYERDVHAQGLVPAGGPPTSVGRRAAEDQVALQGSLEVRDDAAPRGLTREQGASGDMTPAVQLRGALAAGVSERVEMGITGRYSSGAWDHSSDAVDTPDLIDDALMGFGLTSRFGLVESSRLTLDLDTELELLFVPYRQLVTGTVTREYSDDGELWWGSTSDLEARVTRGHAVALLPRLGLSAGLELGPARVLGGMGVTLLPTVRGYEHVRTFCQDGDCDGPEGIYDIDSVTARLALVGHLGLEVGGSGPVSLVVLMHGTLADERGGDSGVGGTLSLRLRL